MTKTNLTINSNAPASQSTLDQSEMAHRLADIESRLRDTQALVARTYERSYGWPQVVADMRAAPDYDNAFVGEPLVTVRIATYNMSEILCDRALASLRRQSYQNWEALVVGDACTDDTAERVRRIGDPRITFRNLAVRGPYPVEAVPRWYVAGIGPMNAALEAARGIWVAPLDHDDEWHDDHLEVLLMSAMRERAEVAYGRLRIVDSESRAEIGTMGAFPPLRGEFGFLSAIHHAGLRPFRYDANCRFADEPGDWNVARRMYDAGVRFHFIDQVVATVFFAAKAASHTVEAKMIDELRDWSRQLTEARDYWHDIADAREADASALRNRVAALEQQLNRVSQAEPRRRRPLLDRVRTMRHG